MILNTPKVESTEEDSPPTIYEIFIRPKSLPNFGYQTEFSWQCSKKINLPIQATKLSDKNVDKTRSQSFKTNGLDIAETRPAIAPQTQEFDVTEEIRAGIIKYALKYEVSYNELFLTIKCESDFSQSARGKAGEIGIAQFMPSTWNYFSDLFGFSGNINNADNQIELMAIAFKNNLKYHWTCYRNLKK